MCLFDLSVRLAVKARNIALVANRNDKLSQASNDFLVFFTSHLDRMGRITSVNL